MRFAGSSHLLWLAALVLGALLLTSCGASPTGSIPASRPRDEKVSPGVDLLAHDGSFEPLALRLESGDRVGLVIANDGFVSHTFTIPRLRLDELIPADSTRRVTFVVPNRGVRFVCRFHAVMHGRLVPTS